MSMFTAEEVSAQVSAKYRDRLRFTVKEITASTNLDIKELAASGAPEGEIVAAGAQTAGRGRLGRSFYSPPEAGIYTSALLRPEFSGAVATAVTTAAAVAAAEAIETVCGVSAGIKWVNDIYIGSRKVCGILTESSVGTDGRLSYAVVGIGINVADKGFPDDIRGKAGAIGAGLSVRPKLTAELWERFFAYYDALPDRAYMDCYRRRSILTGKTVSFDRKGETFSALVKGIDDEARLIVAAANGEELLLSTGEVSIIPKT